ncbi:hypothetical protein Q0Z83_025480 [Actinoplanes sichuanensis]|nr:hypothetical protein Q0Z83_025480 [Actinoplanes sichuanensis]
MAAPETDWIDDELAADPEVGELAESVCLALWVDQAFLRRARLRFLPRSEAALEARLWFSPLCRTNGTLGITLVPAVAERLRARLTDRPDRLDTIAHFTASVRASDRPAAVLEHLLRSEMTATEAPDMTARLARLRDTLLDGDPANENAIDDLSRWILAQMQCLPAKARRRPDVVLVAVAAAERLGVSCPLTVPEDLAEEAGRIRSRLQNEFDVGITVWTDGLRASIPPAPGTHVIRATGRMAAGLTIRPGETDDDPIHATIWPGESQVPLTAWCELSPVLDSGPAHLLAGGQRLADAAGRRQLWVDDEGGVTVLDRERHDAVRLVPGSGKNTVAAFDADGRRMVIGNGRIIYLLDVSGTVATEAVHPAAVAAVALNAQGDTIATVAGDVLMCGESSRRTIVGPVRALWFDADGSVLLATDTELAQYLPDLSSRRSVASWPRNALCAITHDPATGRIAWGLRDGKLMIWHRDRLVQVGSSPWQPTALAIGDRLFVAGNSTEVLRFGLTGGQQPSLNLEIYVRQLRITDGRLIAAGGGGPVLLESDDGTRYLVEPDRDTESDVMPPASDLILRLTPEGNEALSHTAAEAALTAERFRPLPGALVLIAQAPADYGYHQYPRDEEIPAHFVHAGDVMLLCAALHDAGVGVAIRLTGANWQALVSGARRWLRLDVDAILMEPEGPGVDEVAGLLRSLGRRLAVYDRSADDSPLLAPVGNPAVDALLEAAGRVDDAPPPMPNYPGMVPPPPVIHRFPALPADADVRLMILCTALALPGLTEVAADDVLTLDPEHSDRLRRFLAERAGHSALRTGACFVDRTEDSLSITRLLDAVEIVCIANTTTVELTLPSDLVSRQYTLLASTDLPTVADGSDVTLGPYAVRWFRRAPAGATA